jgi:hypothetical protein
MSSSTTRCAYCHPRLLLLLLLLTNIHACRPANTLLVRPLCPLLFFLDTLQQISPGPTDTVSHKRITNDTLILLSPGPPLTLYESTSSSHHPGRLVTALRTHPVTDSPTTFTHDLSPGPRPFLNPNPTRPIADVIDNRTSQTPPDHHRIPKVTRHCLPVASQGACLTHTPTTNLFRHAYERRPCPPFLPPLFTPACGLWSSRFSAN